MFSRILVGVAAIGALAFAAARPLRAQGAQGGRGRGGALTEPAGQRIETADFRVVYDQAGVIGLSSPKDPFAAQVITRGGRLGIFARYRTGPGATWIILPPPQAAPGGSPLPPRTIVYESSDSALKIRQTFVVRDTSLDWTIDLESAADAPLEVGDLAMLFPWNRPGGSEDPKAVFEQAFTKHNFIKGGGSFIYFVRASGSGPYLILTDKPGTSLEYVGSAPATGGGRGRGGGAAAAGAGGSWAAFIHSAAAAAAETRGTWRQPNTSLTLGPRGAPDAKVTYGFRMQWADSYQQMREILYKEGLLDIRVVPGMTVPQDLTATFSLHTQAKIEGIDPEFPGQTVVTSLGEGPAGTDYHLYQVQFKKLGENLITIRHDGGKKTYLEFFSCEPLETLIRKRAAFIAFHQQWRDPSKWYDGLFSVYDMQHKILRSPDDTDGWTGRQGYILACDDTALGKAPYIAEKNVSFPVRAEIEAVEYYLQHFVWGGLQRTDKETPYPYGVYGIPNWHVQRDPVAKRDFEVNANRRPDLAEKMRVFRSYDYPHMVMLYFHMYQIATLYPDMVKYLDARGYLERAFQTAKAYFTYPYALLPNYYETYKWGCYNELVILNLIDALEKEGQKDRAEYLRGEWEKKVKYFVYDDPYPFRSEYAFDRTAYESTYAFAKYGATHEMKPDEKLWRDEKLLNERGIEKWYSHPSVKKEDSLAFMQRQFGANYAVRGVLENAYYLLGADFSGSSDRGAMSYMAPMGGWGILDYGVNFADNPADSLELGYASYLAAWSLMNTGTPESNYGFWFPGKENDGASGWTFMTAKFGRGWDGKDEVRGPWHYDGEIDLGYGAELRMAATVLADDPVFGWIAYGGEFRGIRSLNAGVIGQRILHMGVIPRDGLRRRFYVVGTFQGVRLPGNAPVPEPKLTRFKLELDRDGFAAEKPINVERIESESSVRRIYFSIENRTSDGHLTYLQLKVPDGSVYHVEQDGKRVELEATGDWDYPLRVPLLMKSDGSKVEIIRDSAP